jgi:hypothetical protein
MKFKYMMVLLGQCNVTRAAYRILYKQYFLVAQMSPVYREYFNDLGVLVVASNTVSTTKREQLSCLGMELKEKEGMVIFYSISKETR